MNLLFFCCDKLKSVEIPIDSQLVSIGKSVFESSSIESFYLPSNLKTLGNNWCNSTPNFSSFSISPKNSYFKDIDGKIIVGKSNENDLYYKNFVFAVRTIEDVTIPSYIKTLCSSCLSSCSKLKFVNFLPNSELTEIQFAAFSNSSIKSLCLPNKYVQLDKSALFRCEELLSIEFLADSIEIEKDAFYDSKKLTIISTPNSKNIKISIDKDRLIIIFVKAFTKVECEIDRTCTVC